MDMQTMIEAIIEIEWEMFQHTENIGGRTSCQDDFETFYIMRGSQYANWTDEMRECWLNFLKQSQAEGRNLVAEKYGRMMQFTNLHHYNKHIKPFVPAVPQSHYNMINTIVEAQIGWEKDFAAKYPKLSMAGRPVTSEGDLNLLSRRTSDLSGRAAEALCRVCTAAEGGRPESFHDDTADHGSDVRI